MLKMGKQQLRDMERRYPGIGKTVDYYEGLNLPPCPACGSAHTAAVSAGIVGRSVHVSAATTKIRLLPNGIPEDYYCNACKAYFGGPDAVPDATRDQGSLLLNPRTAADDGIEALYHALMAQAEKGERVQRRSAAAAAPGPQAPKAADGRQNERDGGG
jgi:hypothetical protein